MAKTIRSHDSHPTSHILVLEPTFWTTLIFSGFGPKMDLPFLHSPTFLHVKRLAPKEKRCAWTIPSYQVFVKMSFLIRYLPSCSHFLVKTNFLKLLSYFNQFVYIRFKYRRPHIIIILIIIISRYNFYFKIRTLRYIRILATLVSAS